MIGNVDKLIENIIKLMTEQVVAFGRQMNQETIVNFKKQELVLKRGFTKGNSKIIQTLN